MGSKKQKTTSTQKTTPVYAGRLEGAANSLDSTYDNRAPKIGEFSDNMLGVSNDLLGKYYAGDPAVGAANDWVTNTLGADSASNPYLDDMVGMSNDNVRNQMQAQMGTRGLTGSSDYYGLISKGLAENETGLRYNDYNNREQMKLQAAGMAPGISAAQYQPLAAAMEAGQTGAMLPLQAELARAAGVGGLLGPYTNSSGTSTTKTSGGFMDMLGLGLQAASVFCDRNLKENVTLVGKTPGGVPLYHFNYIGDDTLRVGPMAQEVAELQPEALGPIVNGYLTVDLGELH